MLRTCRVDSAPKGLAGGKDGTRARVLLTSGELQTELPAKIMLNIRLKAGDVLTHIQPGAAGYGPPARRDPERILADVLDEKITAELAKREYGVLVDAGNSRVVRNEPH
jgi:N-methylhydantoinase B/oxoprolinase/acetone carboxylase alpha subunit